MVVKIKNKMNICDYTLKFYKDEIIFNFIGIQFKV